MTQRHLSNHHCSCQRMLENLRLLQKVELKKSNSIKNRFPKTLRLTFSSFDTFMENLRFMFCLWMWPQEIMSDCIEGREPLCADIKHCFEREQMLSSIDARFLLRKLTSEQLNSNNWNSLNICQCWALKASGYSTDRQILEEFLAMKILIWAVPLLAGNASNPRCNYSLQKGRVA